MTVIYTTHYMEEAQELSDRWASSTTARSSPKAPPAS
jgi:ABC-type Fe3+/spermidine/putrescine transport system ATPase subunit